MLFWIQFSFRVSTVINIDTEVKTLILDQWISFTGSIYKQELQNQSGTLNLNLYLDYVIDTLVLDQVFDSLLESVNLEACTMVLQQGSNNC